MIRLPVKAVAAASVIEQRSSVTIEHDEREPLTIDQGCLPRLNRDVEPHEQGVIVAGVASVPDHLGDVAVKPELGVGIVHIPSPVSGLIAAAARRTRARAGITTPRPRASCGQAAWGRRFSRG